MSPQSSPIEPTLPLLNWSAVQVRLRWAYEGVVSPVHQHRQADHGNCYLAWLVRQGTVKVRQGKREWKVRPGQWFISPRGVTEQDLSPDTQLLSINVLCQWITGDNLFAQSDGLLFDAAAFPELEEKALKLSRLVERHVPGASSSLEVRPATYRLFLIFQQTLMDWMETFIGGMLERGWTYAHAGTADERVIFIANLINIAPLNQPFPWPYVQRQTGLDRTHLERLFQAEYGQSAVTCWNQRRLRSATHSLAATSMPLKELSHHLGFSQPGHFTRWFKAQTNVSPTDYRQRHSV